MRIIHCLLAVTALAAMPFTIPVASAKTFVSPDGYRVSVPEDWAKKMGPPDSQSKIVFYFSTGKRKFPAVQVLTRRQGKMTMPFLVAYAPRIMQGTFAGFQQTAAGWTTLGGVPAYDIRGTYIRGTDPRRSLTVCVRQVFALRGGEAYMITTAYPFREGAACEAVSNRILSSVHWQ